MTTERCLLLPNLGAEEGHDWRALQKEPATVVAARLWACLFSEDATVRRPAAEWTETRTTWIDERVVDVWPSDLGPPPTQPAYSWIEPAHGVVPWFLSDTITDWIPQGQNLRLSGPSADVVRGVHDKAFALQAALDLDLLPRSLAPLLTRLEPGELTAADTLLPRLAAQLEAWPTWTGQRFTLKPRWGSSGRGRVAGEGGAGIESLRGALPRLAARGGAIFEPWLERRADLSVCLHLPEADGGESLPTLLGSLEMLTTAGGGYRGHCGEVDNRGRVFSGHAVDETLRAHSAAVASRAQRAGYFGPCGVDAFTYVEDESASRTERLRPAVEFNARSTMGLAALGILRRALPLRRADLGIEPGDRRAFLLGMLRGDARVAAKRIADAGSAIVEPIRLASAEADESGPQPYLFFADTLASLRAAYRAEAGC